MEKEQWEQWGFNLFFSHEGVNDIIKITKSLEDSGVLIDGITETIKHETKKHEARFLGAWLAPLADSATSNFSSNKRYGEGVRRAERRYGDKFFSSNLSFKQYRDYYLFPSRI